MHIQPDYTIHMYNVYGVFAVSRLALYPTVGNSISRILVKWKYASRIYYIYTHIYLYYPCANPVNQREEGVVT